MLNSYPRDFGGRRIRSYTTRQSPLRLSTKPSSQTECGIETPLIFKLITHDLQDAGIVVNFYRLCKLDFLRRSCQKTSVVLTYPCPEALSRLRAQVRNKQKVNFKRKRGESNRLIKPFLQFPSRTKNA